MSHVNVTMHDGTAVITIDRPESMNALNDAALADLEAAVNRAGTNGDVRALVLTGNGRAFCSGGDVKDWSDLSYEPAEDPWLTRLHRMMATLYWMPKPVVAAVNGYAYGAGCDLALVADFRIASQEAKFSERYVRLAFCPDAGGSYLLPRIVGETRAAEMIFTGRVVEASEALEMGLVSEVVEPDVLLTRALEFTEVLASGPTRAIGIAKQNIRQGHTLTFDEALRNELRGGEICAQTADHQEGLDALMNGRLPKFAGR